jgi:hypothetical protein
VLWRQQTLGLNKTGDWRGFVRTFLAVLIGTAAGCYLFILLVDPYDDLPFSLPIEHRIVSISERFMYPQIVRSHRFDSLVIGTSTSQLLDPEILDKEFHVRFANLAMSSAMAWEQAQMLNLFIHTDGPPKALIVGLDSLWCDQKADQHRITFRGFPDWLWDDNPWNDLPHLFNYGTFEIAVRLVGWHLGLYRERIRYDGYEVFVPPESQYDPVRAHQNIWDGMPSRSGPQPPPLPPAQLAGLKFPALDWLEAGLARLPAWTLKILAFMPVSIAEQPVPNSTTASIEDECKARIVAIAKKYGAKVIDWRIPSALTRNENNYWDNMHYRVPVATRIANELGPAILDGRLSDDGTYRLLVR